MSFNELVLAMESAEDRYELAMEKSCQVIDHAFDSFKLLCEEIELELLTEAESTKAADKDKASEGLLVKIGNAIKYFIETLKNFVLDIADSIAAFFSKEENQNTIGEIEQIVNSNEEMKSKKISIPDEKAVSKLVDEYSDKAQREITMLKSGRKSDKSAEQLRSEFNNKKSTAIKATVVVTLSAALGIFVALSKKSKKDITGNTGVDEVIKTIENNSNSVKKDIDSETTKKILDYTKFQVELAKTKAKAVGDYAKDIFEGIRAGITGKEPLKKTSLDSFPKSKKEIKNMSINHNESEETDCLDEYFQTVIEEVETSLSESSDDEFVIDESFFEVSEEFQDEVNALKLEIFEAAHTGEITEEEKDQLLGFLNLENYGY